MNYHFEQLYSSWNVNSNLNLGCNQNTPNCSIVFWHDCHKKCFLLFRFHLEKRNDFVLSYVLSKSTERFKKFPIQFFFPSFENTFAGKISQSHQNTVVLLVVFPDHSWTNKQWDASLIFRSVLDPFLSKRFYFWYFICNNQNDSFIDELVIIKTWPTLPSPTHFIHSHTSLFNPNPPSPPLKNLILTLKTLELTGIQPWLWWIQCEINELAC